MFKIYNRMKKKKALNKGRAFLKELKANGWDMAVFNIYYK